ncbi:MAG: host attachment family protein [Rhizobiaceae bacterium]
MNIDHDAWVVVADSEKALFLRNEGNRNHLQLELVNGVEQDNPPNREQGVSRPGRLYDGTTSHRSAVTNTDWHRLNKEKFAKQISDKLHELARAKKFEKLVLVSAPLILGEMRKQLHHEVTEKVIGEVEKNLTNLPIHEIEKHLE